MTIISFFLFLIVFLLVLWVVKMLLAAFALGEPVTTIIWTVVIILAVLYLVHSLSGGVPTIG